MVTDDFMKNLLNDIRIKVSDTTTLSDSIEISTESYYLLLESRKRCKELLDSDSPSEGQIIDAYINLHMALEVGLNSLYRTIALNSIKKDVTKIEIMGNVDDISFVHKTILFIYNSNFNFARKEAEASTYHKIIGRIKRFNEARNLLLHGHAVYAQASGGSDNLSQTSARKKLTKTELEKQVKEFLAIITGITFYFDCLIGWNSPPSPPKEVCKRIFLETDFVPDVFKS